MDVADIVWAVARDVLAAIPRAQAFWTGTGFLGGIISTQAGRAAIHAVYVDFIREWLRIYNEGRELAVRQREADIAARIAEAEADRAAAAHWGQLAKTGYPGYPRPGS